MGEIIPLWAHQEEGVRRARGRAFFAFFMSMGTGKTATLIHILREIYQSEKRLHRTLILCPPIVIQNWKREFGIHSKINPQDIICLSGSGKKRLELVQDRAFLEDLPLGRILITNYEALLMKDLFKVLLDWAPEVLVCDESHRLKDFAAKRSKLCRELSLSAKYRYLLTGTPILNSPMDLFSQYRILDGGQTFGKNFYGFRSTYFYDKNAYMPRAMHFPLWISKPGAYDEIRAKIQETSFTIKKEECMTLPPLVQQTRYVSLGTEQKKLYEAMKKDFIAFVGSKTCVANLAITKALRMQQIISGHLPMESETGVSKVHHFKENPRLDAAKDLISEITQHSKILVWAVFKDDIRELARTCTELKIGFVEVHGDISTKQKQEAIDTFNTSGDIRVFLGHPGSGGIGINLTQASYALFYSRNFSLEQDLQANARNHRGGSEIHEKITRIDLVAEGTLDEMILERLKNKQVIGESIVREIAEELQHGNKTDDARGIRKTSRSSLYA